MANDKIDKSKSDGSSVDADAAHRARNRTVMLTPEVTGQVRARLQQNDIGSPTTAPTPFRNEDNDFVTPAPARPASSIALPAPFNTPSSAAPAAPAAAASVGMQSSAASSAQGVRPSAPRVEGAPLTPLIGFLVSYDRITTGEYFELRSGRLIVTSENNGSANNLLIEDPTVSPMHAILRIAPSGTLQILDQLSEYGTRLRRFGSADVEQLSGEKANLEHGDLISFGERNFYVCLISRIE